MEEMMLFVLASNNLSFGYRLWLIFAKLLASNAAPRGHDMFKISTHFLHNMVTSPNGLIWSK
jgi:hypothetical protein